MHASADRPRVIVVMGVSGSGKTTIGRALAEALQWPFFDADDFHPPANIAKMAAGQPLDDRDRAPWLAAIRDRIVEHLDAGRPCVVTCSALKARYRDQLRRQGEPILFVHLRGDFETIRRRMTERQHFFRPELLQSQFDALEEPDDALVVAIDQPVDAIIATILRHVR